MIPQPGDHRVEHFRVLAEYRKYKEGIIILVL